ncbi:MAG: alpha-xylosidase [Porticoccaceae bacterium]|nr:alpha-xylosidase [Porticoccaceae bacterium]MDG1306789.1 alpha-xylosidase [Porticoccaceae bacterium]
MISFKGDTPDWDNIPALEVTAVANLSAGDKCLLVETNAGPMEISLYSFGARLRLGERQFGDYGMLVEEPEAISLEVNSCADRTVIEGAGYRLEMEHRPFSFELFHGDSAIQRSPKDGHFVRQFRLPPVAKTEQGWFMSLDLDASEPVYGLGEKWGRVDKRGQLLRSYNHDALGVNAEISYKNTPFAWSPNGWGVFVHTPAPVTHGVGYPCWSQRAYGLLVEDSAADIFLLAADTPTQMISRYTDLTGRAPVPPMWSLGVILSKAYYADAEELLSTARKVREQEMPCDVITLDGRAWQDTQTRFAFEWDASRYPNPSLIIDQLKALNFKICVWEYPLVSVDNVLFEQMSSKGWLLKHRETGETYRYQWDTSCFGEVLTPLPESGIVDFTNPEAYEFWRDCHRPLFELGVDMIKADFGEQIEADMLAFNGDSGDRLHNAYSLLYNRCVYEAAELYCKTGAFLFSRSSWIGSQRYPAQWGGDPQADWGGLAASVRGGISWGLSGAPFYATDVGGFYGDKRDNELYVRWTQAAIFSAHIRLHGIGSREPWSYDVEANRAATEALQLRYRLLPYLNQVMQTSSESGLPAQRAMVLACPEERPAWGFEEQFMLGDSILVAPCLQPGGHVEIYLPRSISEVWKRFPNGETFAGGRSHKLTLSLDEIAAFVPEGQSLPMGPDRTFIDDHEKNMAVASYWPAN